MVAKSTAKYGDRVSLASPIHRAALDDRCLRFRYFAQRDSALSGGSLEVVILSEDRVPVDRPFYRQLNTYNEWIEESVELAADVGSFYVVFVAEQGKQFVSDVMLDYVVVDRSRCSPWSSRKSQAGIFSRTITRLLC